MTRTIRALASIGVVLLFTIACQARQKTADSSAMSSQLQYTRHCVESGRTIDSAFAVEQARKAIAQDGFTFSPRFVQPVRDQGIELGLLISLALVEPRNTVGGGGLVWVDVETGCATVLRRYE